MESGCGEKGRHLRDLDREILATICVNIVGLIKHFARPDEIVGAGFLLLRRRCACA